jgi:hypothetical protein
VDQAITSHAAFGELLAQLSRYSSFLRAEAVTHFVVVSDDESEMGAEAFVSAMQAALGRTITVHAVASEEAVHDCVTMPSGTEVCQDGCTGPNGDAADIGRRYYEAAVMTGGEQFSICTEDWTGLFATLSRAVVVSATLPCIYELPDPPAGMSFDSSRVNVVFTDDGGVDRSLPRAIDPSRCGEEPAWFYDDNDRPSRIDLCPAACELVQASLSGRMHVALGCETEEILY